jgi:hypothetical protein
MGLGVLGSTVVLVAMFRVWSDDKSKLVVVFT